jgi:hypothetical protein
MGTPEQMDKACPLAAYPEDDRPIIVTAQGEVLLTIGEYKAEYYPTSSHKKLMDSAAATFDADDGDDANEKTTPSQPAPEVGTSAQAAEVVLHPLKFADGRGSIVLPEIIQTKQDGNVAQPTKVKKGKKANYTDIDSDSSSESASESALESASESESESQRVPKQKPMKPKPKSGKVGKKTSTMQRSKKRSREDANDDSEPDAADDENEQLTSAKKPRHK